MKLIVRDVVTSQPLDENRRRVAHDSSYISPVRTHVPARVKNDPIALFLEAANFLYNALRSAHIRIGLAIFTLAGQRAVDIDNDDFLLSDH